MNRFLLINKKFTIAIIGLVLINFILEFYYANYICLKFQYTGFYLEYNLLKYLQSKIWFFVLILFSIIINKRSEFISAIYLILILLVYIPGSIIYAYSDGSSYLFYSTMSFLLIVALISPINIKISSIKLRQDVIYYLLILFTTILIIPIIIDFKFNINTNVLKLDDIYEVRNVLKENISVISSYTFWWLAKVVLPVLLIYGLSNKKKLALILSIAILVYLFLISGHKSVYFTPVLILFYYLLSGDYNKKMYYTFFAVVVFLVLINIPDYYLGHSLFKSMFVRRLFFVPALNNEFYFDYFNNNHVYLSNSIFSNFIDYPFKEAPEYLIGREYYNKPEMSANTGLVANGYMDFGYFGVIIYATILSIFLAILNSIKLNHKYFGLIVFYIFIFRGSPFLTTILTHGFWIVLLLAFTLFNDQTEEYQTPNKQAG